MDFTANPAGVPQLGFTHAGRFHADEVFSTALLRILRPDIRIYRGFQVPKNFTGVVYDIGNGPFDHHEKDSPRRPNGAQYAAFGLLWREYGKFFLSEKEARRFDDKFVQPLDIDDNTGTGNTLAGIIGAFNPTWDAPNPDSDTCFFEAVDVAEKMLRHKLESLAAVERGLKAVEEQLAKIQDGLVVLPVYVPWKPVLVPSPAEFVVFPSARGGYSLQCVPKDFNGKTGHKVPMPAAWYGAAPEKLQELTGVAGFTFCHASGFMGTVATLDEAKTLAKISQRQHAERQEKLALRRAQNEAAKAAAQQNAVETAQKTKEALASPDALHPSDAQA